MHSRLGKHDLLVIVQHQYKPYFVVLEQENGTFMLKHYEGGHRAKLIDAIDLRSALGTRKRPAAKGRPHAFEIMRKGGER